MATAPECDEHPPNRIRTPWSLAALGCLVILSLGLGFGLRRECRPDSGSASLYLIQGGAEDLCPAATSCRAFEADRSLIGGDPKETERLFASGAWVRLESGTQVEIPELGLLTNEIVPTTGRYRGQSLWISYVYLRLVQKQCEARDPNHRADRRAASEASRSSRRLGG